MFVVNDVNMVRPKKILNESINASDSKTMSPVKTIVDMVNTIEYRHVE